MNKIIDFEKLGGYPLAEQDVEWMQSSYTGALAALAAFSGNMVVISGCGIGGGNIDNGWVSINGELIPFIGGAIGAGGFNVQSDITSLVFEDGASKPVLIEKVCRLGTPGTFNVSALRRVGTIANLYESFQTFLTNFLTSDNPSYLDPDGKLVLATTKATKAILDANRIIHVGEFYIGDPATDQLYTINHNLDIAGSYKVFANLRSTGANHANDNDISFVTRNPQPNSFQVSVREYVATAQSLMLDYLLIKV